MSRSRDQLLTLWDRAAEALAAVDPALHAELLVARGDLADRLPGQPQAMGPAKGLNRRHRPEPIPRELTVVQQAALTLAGKSRYVHLELQDKTYSVCIDSTGEPYSITVIYGPHHSRVHRLLVGGGNLEAKKPSPVVRRVLAALRAKVLESLSHKD